jgi:hypothetical protein
VDGINFVHLLVVVRHLGAMLDMFFFCFENGLYYLKVKYYIRPLHSDDAHSRLKQGSNSSKKEISRRIIYQTEKL